MPALSTAKPRARPRITRNCGGGLRENATNATERYERKLNATYKFPITCDQIAIMPMNSDNDARVAAS